jgi:predicted XRE-type DNA-binding protein
MKIDTKKIGTFLKSIDGAEYLYMWHCMDMRNGINNLIKRHNLSKQDVCERFKIKPAKYNDYVKGNYNYSVMDMACLNAAFMELEAEKLKDNVPIQVAGSNDR